MPKLRGPEWEEFDNPESPEHTPDLEVLRADRDIFEEAKKALISIEREIGQPKSDYYTGEVNKYDAVSPDNLWERLSYINIDYTENIKDSEYKREILRMVGELEIKICRQYVPYIESLINSFGYGNSPTNTTYKRFPSTETIEGEFLNANSEIQRLKIPEEEREDLVFEMERLKQRFERYKNEPALYMFEEVSNDLQERLYSFDQRDFLQYKPLNLSGHIEGGKGSEEDYFAWFEEKLSLLNELVGKMVNESIKSVSEKIVKSISDYIEYLKVKDNAPSDLLNVEAEIKDLKYRIKVDGHVDEEYAQKIQDKITRLIDANLDYGLRIKVLDLQKLLERVLSSASSEEYAEVKMDFDESDFNMAWTILGLERGAKESDIKRAYKKLVKKYHTDVNKDPDALRKIQNINIAYDIIMKSLGKK